MSDDVHEQIRLALRYEKGHDDALDIAIEAVRRHVTNERERHAVERALIGHYSPAGRAESTALPPEPTWAPVPPPAPGTINY